MNDKAGKAFLRLVSLTAKREVEALSELELAEYDEAAAFCGRLSPADLAELLVRNRHGLKLRHSPAEGGPITVVDQTVDGTRKVRKVRKAVSPTRAFERDGRVVRGE